MRAYIVRRLLLSVPTLLLVTVIVFVLVRLIPGSIIDVMLSQIGEHYSQQGIVAVQKALGLDSPSYLQYCTGWEA